jgi:hypothetical protein
MSSFDGNVHYHLLSTRHAHPSKSNYLETSQ